MRNEMDPKELFRIINRYKYSILLVMLLTTSIAAIFAYYQPNVYKSKTSIQVGIGSKSSIAQQDLLQQALIGGVGSDADIDTEVSILESRFLILNAMKNVNVTAHIWGINKLFKKTEYYLNAPIAIHVEKGKGLMFTLTPIDDKYYQLEVKGISKNDGTKFHYKLKYRYNQIAKTNDYKIIVTKTKYPLDKQYYKFIVYKSNHYANKLISKINVTPHKKKSKVLDITYTDNIPLRAKEFVNALAQAYIKQNIELRTKEATKALSFVNTQLNLIKKNLQKSEKNIENFKTKEKTVDIKMSSKQLSKQLSDLENKISILNMQISILQRTFNKIKKGIALDSLTIIGIEKLDTQGVNSLIQQLQQAILKKQELLREYTTNHPEVQKLSSTISNLKTIIKKSISNILTDLQGKQKLLKTQMVKYQNKLKKLPKAQQDYLSLERKLEFNQKFYTYLLEKKTETEIKKAATVTQNRIIDSALIPTAPIKPKRKIIIGIGLILGLLLGLTLAFIRNIFDDTIKNKEDIKKETNIPIVASIPKYAKKITEDIDLIISKKPKSAIAESFRSLRTNLKFIIEKDDDEAKIIAITSTVIAEGKTTIASNLALALEKYGKKVIIINFDLRKPTLHTIFNMKNSKGLSAYLSNQATLEEIIESTKFKNLDIISAGTVPPDPSELIGTIKVKNLFDELKHRYDYIILDTPPIGLVSDASILLSQSDIVLYVFKAEYSKKEFITIMKEFKQEKKIEKLGIVLNEVKHQKNYYGYGGYYEK